VHRAGVALPARGEEVVDRPCGLRGAVVREQLGHLAAVEPDRECIRGEPLAVRRLDVRAPLHEQLDEARVPSPEDRVVKRAAVGVGAGIEQEP
jgi:hypothetical protein